MAYFMEDTKREHLVTEGPEYCARVVESGSGELVLRPDTPEAIPGNAQYHLRVKVLPHEHPLLLRIEWPVNSTGAATPGFDYPDNENFATVLPDVLFLRPIGGRWERQPAEPVAGGARIRLEPGAEAVELAVGVPCDGVELDALLREGEASPHMEKRELGRSRNGRPVYGVEVSPAQGWESEGVFFLQAYQHHTEWAGFHALAALLRHFRENPAAAGPFRWAVVPCVNVDALYGGWREDLLHLPGDFPGGGNFNRDWKAFHFPETRAVRDFFAEYSRREPVLHGLDLHMGWSSPRHSGAGLTVFEPETIPPEAAAQERAFTEALFARVPIEPFPWVRSSPERPNFAAWMWNRFGCIGQTLEISRFRGFTAEGQPCAISQDYYESLGPAIAETLTAFYGNSVPVEAH